MPRAPKFCRIQYVMEYINLPLVRMTPCGDVHDVIVIVMTVGVPVVVGFEVSYLLTYVHAFSACF